MWQQHLFSARTASPGGRTVDEFHTLTEKIPGAYKAVEKVLRRPGASQHRSVAFIQDLGDRIYIGVDGKVADVLGAEHPCSYEITKSRDELVKGRPITFVQGYFAKKDDAVIPSISELLGQYPKHLEDILVRANAGEEPVKTSSVSFTGGSPLSHKAWDTVAREFMEGKRMGQAATFTHDGNFIGWLESEASIKTAPEAKTFASKIRSEIPFPKKTIPLEIPPKLAFLPLAAITLGVATAGWIVWELVKSMTHQGHTR